MAFKTGGVIQAVGSMSILYKYNSPSEDDMYPGSGKICALGGFKLNAEFISTAQTVPNSVLVPLLGGGSVQLTNDNKSGTITFAVTRIGVIDQNNNNSLGVDTSGNLVEIAPSDAGSAGTQGVDLVDLALKQIARQGIESYGATITGSCSFNGVVMSINFEGCTVVSCEPLRLAGNDVPTYNVVFNYHQWRQV